MVALESEGWRSRLHLPRYSVADTARYARAHVNTVASWHKSHRSLGPVLSSRGAREPLSYLQLVEVAFVASFRRLGVKMAAIRKARQYMQEQLGIEYPFSAYRLKTDGTHIMLELMTVDPDPDLNLLVITDARGQGAWPEIISDRFAQFEYLGDLAIRWWPMGQDHAVIIDPRISFGVPNVNGVPTWAIRGRAQAGETVDEIAEDYNLLPELVEQALVFERLGGPA